MSVARTLALGEYYHVYNRGAHKQGLFREARDWQRFLFGVLYYQSPVLFPNARRLAQTYDPKSGFNVDELDFENVLAGRGIELVSFCIMGNHFHFILRELREGGIARYMQRVQESYAKYFNLKYGSAGHLFQGPYRTVHVGNNEQLTYLSAYIHRNPKEIGAWKGREIDYPWSSYQDYVRENRWGGLLAPEIILDQFEGTNRSNYADFVKKSPAKGFDELLGQAL